VDQIWTFNLVYTYAMCLFLSNYVFVGAFAGLVSQLVREKRDKEEADEAGRERRYLYIYISIYLYTY
jgi:hypothetical protein